MSTTASNIHLAQESTSAGMPSESGVSKKRNRFEQFFYDNFGEMDPNRQHFYQSDEDLNKLYRAMGFREDQLAEQRRRYDEKWNSFVAPDGSLKMQFKGLKPGTTGLSSMYEDTYITRIPGEDNLCIRFYPGGLEPDNMYMFDLYDLANKKAINSHTTSFEIHVGTPPGHIPMTFIPPGRLTSWEINCGIREEDIKPGEERFSLPEGTMFKLVCNGIDHSFFRVPVRQRYYSYPQVLEAVPYV